MRRLLAVLVLVYDPIVHAGDIIEGDRKSTRLNSSHT